ncbi:MAG: arginine--tRNA ligase, partial [Flavobacteriaceae bacterium]|nr:arginine--tRNA ligase [Flavobacteriaceae bacterium]
MNIQQTLNRVVKKAIKQIYDTEIQKLEFQETRKDFEGDITIVVFPLLKFIKGNPFEIATKLGEYLKANIEQISDFNVVKGFLNLVLSDEYLLRSFSKISTTKNYGIKESDPQNKAVMVEYSSPNTNKPLHLGHIRNNLLGYSVSEIIAASGKKVYKTQIINDRGIHICKSMLAWERFGNGETPENTGLKGDKLVGNYYVKFDKEYKKEIEQLISEGLAEDDAKKSAPILLEAQKMLIKWENGDKNTVALWKKMNQWVYDGFEKSYK